MTVYLRVHAAMRNIAEQQFECVADEIVGSSQFDEMHEVRGSARIKQHFIALEKALRTFGFDVITDADGQMALHKRGGALEITQAHGVRSKLKRKSPATVQPVQSVEQSHRTRTAMPKILPTGLINKLLQSERQPVKHETVELIAVQSSPVGGRRSTKRASGTLFGEFYRRTFRPKFRGEYCDAYLRRMDKAADELNAWNASLTLEEMDVAWFGKLVDRLAAQDISDGGRKTRLLDIVRIVRSKFPYRKLLAKPTWRLFELTLRTEARGYFGEYFVRVYAPKVPARSIGTYHSVVMRFLCWREQPMKLVDIDGPMLDRFLDHLRTLKLSSKICMYYRAIVREIINDWTPGRIPSLRTPRLPNTPIGTVENYIVSRFIPALERDRAAASKLIFCKQRRSRPQCFCRWQRPALARTHRPKSRGVSRVVPD